MNRGQNRNKIFHTDCHYQKFLSLLKDCVERWRWGCILKDLVGPIKRSRNISGDAPKHSFKCDPPLTRNWSKNVGDIESSFWQFNEMKMKTVFLWTWPLVHPRFIPACAGNRRRSGCCYSTTSVHPRVCGEQNDGIMRTHCECGSSPRVRGTG